MAARESGLSSNITGSLSPGTKHLPQLPERIVKLVHHPFLQWNDRIVRDGDLFGANLGAALGDVTKAHSLGALELLQPILRVERMHLQRRHINQETRADELVVL